MAREVFVEVRGAKLLKTIGFIAFVIMTSIGYTRGSDRGYDGNSSETSIPLSCFFQIHNLVMYGLCYENKPSQIHTCILIVHFKVIHYIRKLCF